MYGSNLVIERIYSILHGTKLVRVNLRNPVRDKFNHIANLRNGVWEKDSDKVIRKPVRYKSSHIENLRNPAWNIVSENRSTEACAGQI